LDAAQYAVVKHKLEAIIDPKLDSLRFYNLGNNYKSRVEHVGAKPSFSVEDALIV
jgi:CRISPR-associated protein Cas2